MVSKQKIKFFDIEGELLSKEQVIERGIAAGLKASTVRYRLEKGNRTWKNLLETPESAQARTRKAFDTLPKRER